MFLNLCPFTIGITNSSFNELKALAKKYGFGGLDFVPSQFGSVEEVREASEACRSLGLKWGLLPMPCDFLHVDDNVFNEGIEKLREVLPMAQAAGCKRAYNHIWPGSDFMTFDENYKWHKRRLKILSDLLGEFGVRLGLEFIGAKTLRDSFKYTFIYNIHQALELADSVSPNIGLIIDCFHWYTSGGTLEDISAVKSADKIVNVHANDAYPGRTREEQVDLERQMPLASGIVDAPGILRVLNGMGYDGPVICEPFQPTINRLQSMENKDVASEVSKVMKNLFIKTGIETDK